MTWPGKRSYNKALRQKPNEVNRAVKMNALTRINPSSRLIWFKLFNAINPSAAHRDDGLIRDNVLILTRLEANKVIQDNLNNKPLSLGVKEG